LIIKRCYGRAGEQNSLRQGGLPCFKIETVESTSMADWRGEEIFDDGYVRKSNKQADRKSKTRLKRGETSLLLP